MRCGSFLTALVGLSAWLGVACGDRAWAAQPAPAGATFQTTAPAAMLMDGDTGTVLFEKNADAPVSPAATAKIMTAELVFQQLAGGRLKSDDLFTVSENAWRRGGAPSGGTAMFAAVNSRVRVDDLVRGLTVVSGNDAAIALAEGLAGTEAAFAERMTARARELGLAHTTFTSAWGQSDPRQTSTARDMANLARKVILAYPAQYRVFGEREFLWNRIRQANRNPLLAMDLGADGLRTGESPEGGYGIVASALQDGRRLIVAIFGLPTAKERTGEAAKLLQWGFRAFERRALFAPGEVVGTAQVFGGTLRQVDLVAPDGVALLQPRDTGEPLAGRIVYDGPLVAPLGKDAIVARLKLTRGGLEVLDVPLRTGQSVAVGSLPRRAVDAGLELGTSLMRTYVLKR